MQQCDAQKQKSVRPTKNTTTKSSKMKRPSINNQFETLNLNDYKDGMKIEKNADIEPGEIRNVYKYRKETESEIIQVEGTKEYLLRYIRTYKGYPFYSTGKAYYGKSGYIQRKVMGTSKFSFKLGEEYQFDESGKLIKTIDHDKGWDFSYEDVMAFVKEKYKDKILVYNDQYGFNIKKKKSYDGRNYWEIYVKPDYHVITQQSMHSYDILKLDGTTGKILCHQQWTDYYGEPQTLRKTIVPDTTIPPSERPTAQIYKTYEGKGYTEAEWKIFEQEQYNEHLRKTGRADLIKPTETPKAENKKSFLADEDHVKPQKKKGFWG